MVKLSISLWSAALGELGKVIKDTEKYADYFHFDVADGHFVPNFLFFPDLVKALRPLTSVPFVVHLMIEEPEKFLSPFVDAGANVLAIHPEVCKTPEKVIAKTKNCGIKASLVLDSNMSAEEVKPPANIFSLAGHDRGQELRNLLKVSLKSQQRRKQYVQQN